MGTQLVTKLCLLCPFLLILSVAACTTERGKVSSFFKCSFLSFPLVIAQLSLIHWVTVVAYGKQHKQHCFLCAIIRPPSSHPVWPSRFVSGHFLQTTQGDTWLLRCRWLTVSLGCFTTASWPPSRSPSTAALGYMSCRYQHPPRACCCFSATLICWLCCEGHWNG